jgi:hypothetical protein
MEPGVRFWSGASQLLAALPGVGMIDLAQIIAEIGPILDNAAPAAAENGPRLSHERFRQTRGVYFRWATDTRARKAITALGHNSRMQSPWAGRLYTDACARGKHNPHVTRIVARGWLRVILACWNNATA